jgi:anti-sigma B factor antagonist
VPATNLAMTIREMPGDVRVVDIQGEITAFSEKEITEAHEEAGKGARAVVLNFEGLDYMNSGGIGLLVTTLIRAQRAGHALRAFGLNEHYREIFSLTRLDEAIGIYDDEESAVRG